MTRTAEVREILDTALAALDNYWQNDPEVTALILERVLAVLPRMDAARAKTAAAEMLVSLADVMNDHRDAAILRDAANNLKVWSP